MMPDFQQLGRYTNQPCGIPIPVGTCRINWDLKMASWMPFLLLSALNQNPIKSKDHFKKIDFIGLGFLIFNFENAIDF